MTLSKFLFDKQMKLYYFYSRTLKIKNRGERDDNKNSGYR